MVSVDLRGVRNGVFWIQILKFLDLPDLDPLLFVQIRILNQKPKTALKTSISASKLTFKIED
jgi:hypothetical protein